MTHDHNHDHGTCCNTAASPFSAEETQAFRNEDAHTAKAILILMLSIFTLGLIGYSAVALWVA
jgi:hypothetical protein